MNAGFVILSVIEKIIHPSDIKVGDILSYDDCGHNTFGLTKSIKINTKRSTKFTSRGEVKLITEKGYVNISWNGDEFNPNYYKIN